MKRWSLWIAGVAFALAVMPVPEAEAQVTYGPQVILWDLDRPGVGARVDFGLADALGIDEGGLENLRGSVNASYVFGESQNFPGGSARWNALVLNANGAVPFEVEAAVTPYAGAGINYTRYTWSETASEFNFRASNSDSGLNLVGGIEFGLGDLPGFAELQYSTSGGGYLTLGFGVMFGG